MRKTGLEKYHYRRVLAGDDVVECLVLRELILRTEMTLR